MFVNHFGAHRWLRVQEEIGGSSWFGFALVLTEDAPIPRAERMVRLTAGGVDVRPVVAGDFAKNEVLKWFDYSVHGGLANAERIDE